MDYIFWAQVVLFFTLMLELILRLAAPLMMPAGSTSTRKYLNTSFEIRFVVTALIIFNLEFISDLIASAITEKMIDNIVAYPIWLLPTLLYSAYAITAQQNEKKKAS